MELPTVGGKFCWRRSLASSVLSVGGILIKAAARQHGGVGEGATFFEQHGRHMTAADAAKVYDEAKTSAMQFSREIFSKLRHNGKNEDP